MALINFVIAVNTTTNPPTATLDTGVVAKLRPFDRLNFVTDQENIPVYVNLGANQEQNMVALVQYARLPNFTLNVQPDQTGGFQVIVTLENGGNQPQGDPP